MKNEDFAISPKGRNKGFTLLELLIAVLVLAIVIIPLLHSFVSSFRVNARSRETMRATTLAQNEMELFEKEKIEDLADPAKFTYRGWGTVTPEPDSNGCYTFVREGIVNDDSGRSMFDVVVRLNPERAVDTDRYYSQNTNGFLYINTFSNLDCGSFVQPLKSNINDPNNRFCDETVYSIYEANRLNDSWNTNKFRELLAREITVQISQFDDGTKIVTKAKVIYDYYCDSSMVKSGYQKYTKEQIIFDNSQEFDEDGNPIELNSIYLFYTPRGSMPKCGTGVSFTCDGKQVNPKVDKITIKNESKLPVNVYILRQDILSLSEEPSTGEYKQVEWNGSGDYNEWFELNKADVSNNRAELEVHDYMDAEGKTYGNYYTNLEKIDTNPNFSIKLQDLANASRVFSDADAIDLTKLRVISMNLESDHVKASETKDRIYTMVVEVYRHVEGQNVETTAAHSDPLVVMDGSKLE